ncbi:MAG: hypothetical protein RMK73_03580 [Geminicoccaceae bacterium]|nr:hypothetical protein [Geminicoccaceae bacterium]MDW8124230.1 hypothetical protein [Geminicoccaceae bacterium]MDW8340547.1 hypothetical protein [Geminicoccaceae bacterium]
MATKASTRPKPRSRFGSIPDAHDPPGEGVDAQTDPATTLVHHRDRTTRSRSIGKKSYRDLAFALENDTVLAPGEGCGTEYRLDPSAVDRALARLGQRPRRLGRCPFERIRARSEARGDEHEPETRENDHDEQLEQGESGLTAGRS